MTTVSMSDPVTETARPTSPAIETSAPAVVRPSRVIPLGYFRISVTQITLFKDGEPELICMRTNTDRAEAMVSEELIEVAAETEYQGLVGDCFGLQPERWSYQINVFTGRFVRATENGQETRPLYFGNAFHGGEESVLTLSRYPIPVQRVTTPIYSRDILDKLIFPAGTRISLVDSATGILVYETASIPLLPDLSLRYFLQTISLSTNAPIGGSSEGIEYEFSEH